ncbi:TerD family protein, partial [Frankia sp. AvcI1]
MTSVSLSKGGNVSLSKVAPNLTAVTIGLGWKVRQTSGADYDLDASAIVVNEAGRVLSDSYFVFFNNLVSPDGGVTHLGDNLVGGGGGDDEQINVDLRTLTPQAAKVVFAVSIYDADA